MSSSLLHDNSIRMFISNSMLASTPTPICWLILYFIEFLFLFLCFFVSLNKIEWERRYFRYLPNAMIFRLKWKIIYVDTYKLIFVTSFFFFYLIFEYFLFCIWSFINSLQLLNSHNIFSLVILCEWVESRERGRESIEHQQQRQIVWFNIVDDDRDKRKRI